MKNIILIVTFLLHLFGVKIPPVVKSLAGVVGKHSLAVRAGERKGVSDGKTFGKIHESR